ncbi:MAG TPA: TonB-dependent receptor, partial [Gemmatimonadales bacterium]|nr:TonB-dependent receptor [Gemmatimonadales bacterium]
MPPGLLGALELLLAVQASQAVVAGTIRDGESGGPLGGVVVTLTDLDRGAVSDAAGRYRLTDVPAGPQHLTVKRVGYAPRTIHALVPGEGRLDLDLSLRPLPLHLPTIVVRSPISVRGREAGDSTPFPDRGISSAAIRNHPLLAEPDGFLALGGGEVTIAPEAPAGVHLRGGASDQTAYLLDGVPVFSPYHAAGTFSAWNPDALERLQIVSASPSLAPPDALSGAVVAATRAPGAELRVQGTLSTSHGRVTIHGPLGASGAGFLLSTRSGFPGVVAPKGDPSYLRGSTGDLLAKVEAPAFGGRLRILGYGSRNELDAAAVAESPETGADHTRRNGFEWSSRSVGLEWRRRSGRETDLRIQVWNALGEAEAGWHPPDQPALALESDREDQGVLATAERSLDGRSTGAGIRLQRSRTSYRVAARRGTGIGTSLVDRMPLATAFVRHRRPLRTTVTGDVALSATG